MKNRATVSRRKCTCYFAIPGNCAQLSRGPCLRGARSPSRAVHTRLIRLSRRRHSENRRSRRNVFTLSDETLNLISAKFPVSRRIPSLAPRCVYPFIISTRGAKNARYERLALFVVFFFSHSRSGKIFLIKSFPCKTHSACYISPDQPAGRAVEIAQKRKRDNISRELSIF